jgi:hypothetical protein
MLNNFSLRLCAFARGVSFELKTSKKITSATLGNPYIPDAVPENNTYIVK